MKIVVTHMKKNDWILTLMVAVFLLVFVVTASISYADTDDRDKMWDRCSLNFRGNQELINTCVSQQVRSYNQVKRYVDKYLDGVTREDYENGNLSFGANVVINCSNKWRDFTFDSYRWDLVNYCVSSSLR